MLYRSLWPQSGCPDSPCRHRPDYRLLSNPAPISELLTSPSAFILSGTGTCGKKGCVLGDHVSRAVGEAIDAHHPWPDLEYGEARSEGLRSQ